MTFSQMFILAFAGHLVTDYTLQGCLANMKQKSWWHSQTSDPKYDGDYREALFSHAVYWSIGTFAIVYWNHPWVLPIVIVNALIHAYIDDLKANKLKINLITDQHLHLTQILLTLLLV